MSRKEGFRGNGFAPRRRTIPPGHTVLTYRGTEVQCPETGRHRVPNPESTVTVDLRDRLIPVAPQ